MNTPHRFLNSCQRALALWAALSAGSIGAFAAASAPYVLEGTEVVPTPAPRLNRSYEVYVSLPSGYGESVRRYPVVYVTDAPYAFPLVRAIAGRVDRHGVGLEDFILVGLSYAKGESGVSSRNRDYTPTQRARERASPDPGYGGSAAYLDFVESEVIALIDKRYRTDPMRRVFVGHSYGSLLGLRALLERPGVFSHYILGSPSLWFDREHALDELRRFAKGRKDLAGRVRFYVGGLEQPTQRKPNEENMVRQMTQYVSELNKQRWPSLDVKASVLNDEDHATVFPRLVTQGLMWALPKSR